MMIAATPLRVAFAACAAVLALEAHAGCPVSSLATQKAEPCAKPRSKCRTFKPSPEIERITRGAYFEYVGLVLFGPPMTNWLAVDVDKAEVIYIQRYPLHSYERLRYTTKEPEGTRISVRKVEGKFTDYARRRDISPAKLEEVVCLLNALWKSARGDATRYATDVATGIYLLDGTTAKDLGGLGLAAGDAEKLQELLDSLKDPAWEWWDVFSEK